MFQEVVSEIKSKYFNFLEYGLQALTPCNEFSVEIMGDVKSISYIYNLII